MEYTLLSELSLQCQDCKIKVRICRIWESTAPFLKGDIFSLECLLIDEKAYSLQATIRKQDAEEMRSQLAEGNLYQIDKFNVIPNKKKFVAVDRLYMIQINKWTKVTRINEAIDTFPLYSFNFLSFPEAENQRYNDAVLTDVFGQIAAVSEVTHKYVGQTLTPIRNLEIQDLEKNVLSVTLWDQFALDFDDDGILERERNRPVVIVLAGMTVRSFRERIHLSTCSASKIYINLNIPAVFEFQNRLQPLTNSIQRITMGKDQLISPQEEMCMNRKTITELLQIHQSSIENMKFTCKAKIAEIDTSFGWWYKACYNCKTSIKTYDDTFWCSNCCKADQTPIPWYRLNTIVEDKTGSCNFTIFGKCAQDLVRSPAQNLATLSGSDQFTLPPALKTIIGEKHIFQVVPDTPKFKSSASIPSFKVLKIFTQNLDTKAKSPVRKKLFVECEEKVDSPATNKQICQDLFEETSPGAVVSSSSVQPTVDLEEIQPTKRRRLRLVEGSSNED